MKRYQAILDDLRGIMPIGVPAGAATIAEDPAYTKLKSLIDELEDNPSLDQLSREQLQAFKTFKITLYRAEKMEPQTARKHIGAVWMGNAKEALMLMPQGKDIQIAFHQLMAGGIG